MRAGVSFLLPCLFMILFLSACGYRGPLYLPEQPNPPSPSISVAL